MLNIEYYTKPDGSKWVMITRQAGRRKQCRKHRREEIMTQKERAKVLDALYNLRAACSYKEMNSGADLVKKALSALESVF